MLKITNFDKDNNYRTLNLNDDIFHKALKNVLRGEKNFHVLNPCGEDFDLVYYNNTEMFKKEKDNPQNDLVNSKEFYPPYLTYDEYDTSKLYLRIFDPFDTVIFEVVDEYTVVLARILLANSKKVVFTDERIKWFIPDSKNLLLGNDVSFDDAHTMRVVDYLKFDACISKFDIIWSVTLFHAVFFLQWLTDSPLDKIKYVEVAIEKTEGIGSLLNNVLKMSSLFRQFGWKTLITPKSSRYKDELLNKYFRLSTNRESDANDENTIYITAFFSMALTYPVLSQESGLNEEILNPQFLEEMNEYRDAIIGNKRMLGVLIRGTDYIVSNFPIQPLPFDILIKMIRERIDERDYDGFFLATEDIDYYNALKEAFPKEMRSISQERHSASEFKNAKFISDLEKEKESGVAYDALVEDTTANYFYAVYMLSQCESVFVTPDCNGVNMVRSFNKNKFIFDECYGMMDGKIIPILPIS